MINEHVRRWRIPATISVAANLILLAYVGVTLRSETAPPEFPAGVRRIHIIDVPIVRRVTRITVVKRIRRPARPRSAPKRIRSVPAVGREGARRRRVLARKPTTSAPAAPAQPVQTASVRNPFAPAIAPAAVVPHASHAQNPTPLPSPATPTAAAPVQVAIVSGFGSSQAGAPAPRSGSPGGASTGAAPGSGRGVSGAGRGGGGVLPFGLRGGGAGRGQRRIVYVLDISGSMTTRIATARQQLLDALAGLDPNDLFDILTFNGTVQEMEPYLEPATADDLTEADWFLSHIVVVGSTNLEAALSDALSLLHVREIVLITDGVPTVGETNFKVLAREIDARNYRHVRIDTIGLVGINPDGSDESFQATRLLQQLARDSGGDCRLVPLGSADTGD